MRHVKKQVATVLVVPCYNEEHRLDSAAFIDFLADSAGYFILFVDDGSRDQTVSKLNAIKLAAGADSVEVMSLSENRGKAEAIRQGIQKVLSNDFPHAKTVRFVGYLDADLAAPISEFERLVDVASRLPKILMVLGARLSLSGHAVNRKLARKVIGKTFSYLASRLIGIPVHDTQCGAKLFRFGNWLEVIFEHEFSDRWLFDVEILARVKALYGANAASVVFECPLESWHEIGGSRLTLRDFLKAPIGLLGLVVKYRLPGMRAVSLRTSDARPTEALAVYDLFAGSEKSVPPNGTLQSDLDRYAIPMATRRSAA